MASKFYVFVYDMDALYGQSDDAQLRLIGPFDRSEDADEWERLYVKEDREDSLSLPLPAMSDGKLILRVQKPTNRARA